MRARDLDSVFHSFFGIDQNRLDDEIPLLGDRFQVIEEIGRGSMGVVFRALDRSKNGRATAIKLTTPARDTAVRMRLEQRLIQEARLLKKVTDHPRIVNIFAFKRNDQGQYYIAMELLVGRCLSDVIHDLRMANRQWIPEHIALLGRQCAHGLAHLHSDGFLHRDVKPSNICLRFSPPSHDPFETIDAVLMDFGLAKDLSPNAVPLSGGAGVGTWVYCAPEQMAGRPDELGRSDVYSLGVVLGEICFGTQFLADKRVPQLRLPTVPAWLHSLIGRMVSPDADNRPRAIEVISQIDSFLSTQSHRLVRRTRFDTIGGRLLEADQQALRSLTAAAPTLARSVVSNEIMAQLVDEGAAAGDLSIATGQCLHLVLAQLLLKQYEGTLEQIAQVSRGTRESLEQARPRRSMSRQDRGAGESERLVLDFRDRLTMCVNSFNESVFPWTELFDRLKALNVHRLESQKAFLALLQEVSVESLKLKVAPGDSLLLRAVNQVDERLNRIIAQNRTTALRNLANQAARKWGTTLARNLGLRLA